MAEVPGQQIVDPMGGRNAHMERVDSYLCRQGSLSQDVVRESHRLATQRQPGNPTERGHAPSCGPNITATRFRPHYSGDEQVEPSTPRPPLPRDLLMCRLNQVLRGRGHEIADDGGLDLDLGPHLCLDLLQLIVIVGPTLRFSRGGQDRTSRRRLQAVLGRLHPQATSFHCHGGAR